VFYNFNTWVYQKKSDLLADPVADLKKRLSPKEISFVVVRIMEIQEQFKSVADNVKYAKPYWGLVLWHGPETSVMAKALSSHHWKDFCKLVRKVLTDHNAFAMAGYHHSTRLDEVSFHLIRDSLKLIDHNAPED